MKKLLAVLFFSMGLIGLVGYVAAAPAASVPTPVAMSLKSSAFGNNGAIPAKYTCDSENLSPPLSWEGSVPGGTESFVIICYDSHPVANNWVHWVVYNIPLGTVRFDEGFGGSGGLGDIRLEGGALQGRTTFGSYGYGGPCPPPDSGVHKYHFKIYALDVPSLPLNKAPELVDREDVDKAMRGHVVGEGELIGTYEK